MSMDDGMLRGPLLRRHSRPLLAAVAATAFAPVIAAACPFCGAVGQSLAQRRDAAAVVAVGEATGAASADAVGLPAQAVRIDQVLRGAAARPGDIVTARVTAAVAGTALLFGVADGAGGDTRAAAPPPLRWSAIAADEAFLGYAVAAPHVGRPEAERLRWFATRLEHPDPAIAADAFTEFGLAPFAAVRAAADACDVPALEAWLADPGVDQRRRGLYGLLLGVAARAAADPTVAGSCSAALRRAIDAPGDDFRAGFDGILAGLLVAEGTAGLDALEDRGLFGPAARPLDQRHLLAALRFAGESLADTIPRERIVAATRLLLARPAVAADAAIDLARLRDWDAVDEVAALWDTHGRDDPLVRRAVAGYLAACPLPAAARRLEALRIRDPERLGRALEAAALPVGR
jgi:hypothetical protein